MNIKTVKILDTGGHSLLYFGELTNGTFYTFSTLDNNVAIYNRNYEECFESANDYRWEHTHHLVTYLNGTEENVKFRAELNQVLKDRKGAEK